MSKLSYFGKSFLGRRSNNEDSYFSDEILPGIYLFAVADGMGGANGGEIASEIAIKTAKKVVLDNKDNADLKQILKDIYWEIQKNIKERISNSPELQGMGTTMTCLLIKDGLYAYANVGDSRLYKVTDKDFIQLSTDHSYIQEYIEEKGENPPKDLVRKFGNIITRVLDGNADKPDIFPVNKDYISLKMNEMFVLCSDGLLIDKGDSTNYIRDFLLSGKNIEKQVSMLIDFAYNNESNDNITLVVVENGKLKRNRSYLNEHIVKSRDNSPKKKSILILSFIISIIVLVFFLFHFGYLDSIMGKEKKNDVIMNSSSESVQEKVIIEQPVLNTEKEFDGFESGEISLSLENEGQVPITWYDYDNESVDFQYRIYVEKKGLEKRTIDLSTQTNANLKDLGIDKKGDYKLTISVIIGGKEIKGGKMLTLNVY